MIKWLKELFTGKTVEEIDKTWPLEINFDEGDTIIMNYPLNTSLEQKHEIIEFLQDQFDQFDNRRPKVIFIPSDMQVVGVIRRTPTCTVYKKIAKQSEQTHHSV